MKSWFSSAQIVPCVDYVKQYFHPPRRSMSHSLLVNCFCDSCFNGYCTGTSIWLLWQLTGWGNAWQQHSLPVWESSAYYIKTERNRSSTDIYAIVQFSLLLQLCHNTNGLAWFCLNVQDHTMPNTFLGLLLRLEDKDYTSLSIQSTLLILPTYYILLVHLQ